MIATRRAKSITILPRPSRLSFRWWESLTLRDCACGAHLDVFAHEPAYNDLLDEGCSDTTCKCGRVVTVYDLKFSRRAPPRGPAPSQSEREAGVTEEDVYERGHFSQETSPVSSFGS